MHCLPLCLFLVMGMHSLAQTVPPLHDTTPSYDRDRVFERTAELPEKFYKAVGDRYQSIEIKLRSYSSRILAGYQRTEAHIYHKLLQTDSAGALELHASSNARYERLMAGLKDSLSNAGRRPKEYISRIDSLETAFKFLQRSELKIPGMEADRLGQLKMLQSQAEGLQERFQRAGDVQAFVREEEEQLKVALANTPLLKELRSFDKEIYYYQEQVKVYKELFDHPDKLEEKIMAILRQAPAFQQFMQKNSLLAQLFPAPENYGTPAALTGLQTRTQVAEEIRQKTGMNSLSGGDGNAGTSIPQEYVQQAERGIDPLKDKVRQLGGGSSETPVPDFKPNTQRTTPFLRRLEYGINIQNLRGGTFLPSMCDVALTAGYKINGNTVAGIGASYKLGLGNGWDHFQLTSQGVGLRSYVDVKLKGSIWVTGGAEYNYMQSFRKLEELHDNIDVWQKSAVIGLTKKYRIGRRKGNLQMLYDLLAHDQRPSAQPLKFRIGYSF